MFVLLMEPHATVKQWYCYNRIELVAMFVPGNFGLFRRNSWQPLAEPGMLQDPG